MSWGNVEFTINLKRIHKNQIEYAIDVLKQGINFLTMQIIALAAMTPKQDENNQLHYDIVVSVDDIVREILEKQSELTTLQLLRDAMETDPFNVHWECDDAN